MPMIYPFLFLTGYTQKHAFRIISGIHIFYIIFYFYLTNIFKKILYTKYRIFLSKFLNKHVK